jgi:two-component system sensor kinase FixL
MTTPSWISFLAPYLIAIALIGLGVEARLLLDKVLGDRVVFLFLVPGLLAASALGGLIPGLVSTALATLAGWALLERYGVILGNEIDAGLFAGLGIAVAIGGERLRRTQRHEAKMVDQALERQAYLQTVLSTVPEGMIVIDERGVIQSFSPAAERLFGWAANDVVGRHTVFSTAWPSASAFRRPQLLGQLLRPLC